MVDPAKRLFLMIGRPHTSDLLAGLVHNFLSLLSFLHSEPAHTRDLKFFAFHLPSLMPTPGPVICYSFSCTESLARSAISLALPRASFLRFVLPPQNPSLVAQPDCSSSIISPTHVASYCRAAFASGGQSLNQSHISKMQDTEK